MSALCHKRKLCVVVIVLLKKTIKLQAYAAKFRCELAHGYTHGLWRLTLGLLWQVRQHRVYSMVVSAQVFEYKMSHVLDKAMESVFGYITVLPGAFSAYRWIAIENAPLHEYFKTEEQSMEKISAFEANMFLAEDRVRFVLLQSPGGLLTMMCRFFALRSSPKRAAIGPCTTWLVLSQRLMCLKT